MDGLRRDAVPRLMLLAFMLLAPRCFGAEAWEGGLLGELMTSGVLIEETPVMLRPPQADPRWNGEKVLAAQKELAGGRGWSQFTRDSVVAPLHIDLDALKDASGKRIGLRAHFAFVVHASVEQLRDGDAMERLFQGEAEASESEGFRSSAIPAEELSALGIETGKGTSYGWLETVLLKKIEVTGVLRSERIDEASYFAVAWKLDERFSDREPPHDSYRNRWIKLDRDELGNLVRSEPRAYAGTAGYVFVSPVAGIDGASLIEGEVVLHEPEAWFSGSNLLRSKLPLIIQESARKLRRGLQQ